MVRIVVGFYVVMIFIFAIYGNWWGDYAYRGFGYNLGQALIWPAILIPGLGKAIGALLLLGFIGFFVVGRK